MPPASSHAVLRYIRRLAGASSAGDPTDAQLLARFLRDRDEAAFATLVDRHGPMVLNVCRRRLVDANEVDDAFQAVFLVLVKKARSIRNPSLLGNWLYGVSCRTAANARRQASHRQSRTKEIVDMPATESTFAEGWHELRPLLDEELERLPEKYRAPLVLCYLQGKTYTQAARILGWADGTVSSRLARGRALLRDRLIKRGLMLSVAALTSLLSAHAAQATFVPAALAATTIRAAVLVAAGKSLAAGVSTHAVALTEGVLKAMFLNKLKIATAVVLTLASLGMGGGMFTYHTWAREKGEEKKVAATPKVKGELKPEIAANAPAPPEVAQPTPVANTVEPDVRHPQLYDFLSKKINYDGVEDPQTKLIEVLDELATQYNTTFEVNERAFEADGIAQDKILKTLLVKPDPLKPALPIPKMRGVRFSTMLKKVLSRIPSSSPATFIMRRDHIEITTESALFREFPKASVLPLVTAYFDKTPLDDALKHIATSSEFNIVLDSAKLEKNPPTVTADLHNVPVDTAVRILAEMADMRAVLIDNVLFVTAKPTADRMQKEDKRKGMDEKDEKPAQATR